MYMKIYDCITYFDENVILKIRLNILYNVVDKFIITEGSYDHRGKKRKLNFNIKENREFSKKIVYIPVGENPDQKNPRS